jgi:hypothetical protein
MIYYCVLAYFAMWFAFVLWATIDAYMNKFTVYSSLDNTDYRFDWKSVLQITLLAGGFGLLLYVIARKKFLDSQIEH